MEPGFYLMDCMEGMRQFPDGFFDLAIVDPIYGDVTTGGYMMNHCTGVAKPKEYHVGIWSQGKTGKAYFDELRRVSVNQIIWGGNYFADMLPSSQCWLVWDKDKPEGCHYADCELAWTSFNKAVRMFKYMWNGMLQENMKNKENRIHPTQKPVALYNWILKNYAHKGDKILDTHVGSASSLIACHRAGLEYWGFEIDPVYYKAARERLDKETAQVNIMDILGGTT